MGCVLCSGPCFHFTLVQNKMVESRGAGTKTWSKSLFSTQSHTTSCWQLNPMHLFADSPWPNGMESRTERVKMRKFTVWNGGISIGKAEAVCTGKAELLPLSLLAEPCAGLPLLSGGQLSQLCPLTNPCALQPAGIGWEAEKARKLWKHCLDITKTSLSYQHCVQHETKTQAHTSYCEEN